ncbi:hypothetical protein BKI52_18575 [marine bacterium AO1-C]|nr:hypothetical protein BKI52_18575 [marine bacterium AO1-C]
MSIDALKFLLHRSSSLSILIPCLLSIMLFSKLDKSYKVLSIFLYFATFIQAIAILIRSYGGESPNNYNLFLFHILILVEFCFLTWFFKIELNDFVSHNFFLVLIVIFVVFSLSNTLIVMKPFDSFHSFWKSFRYLAKFNNYAQLLEDLFLMCFAFLSFYKLLKELRVENLEKEAFFWFNIGILIYFSSKFTLDIFNNFLIASSRKLRDTTWAVHSVTNTLLHIFYSIALWRNSRS